MQTASKINSRKILTTKSRKEPTRTRSRTPDASAPEPLETDRAERLDEIRAAIEDGTYQIDSDRLARVLIDRHIIRKPD